MPLSANARNSAGTSSTTSRRRVVSQRKSSSRRNTSLSRDGSASFSAVGTGVGKPLPPPIIQVGEGDEDARIVVDVKLASGKNNGRDFRVGSGESSKREKKASRSIRNTDTSGSPSTSAFVSSNAKRPPPDHAKRWSPPPFPNVSSSSSDLSSKSELSSTPSSIDRTPGQRLLNHLNATPAHGTQLSLPNPAKSSSLSTNQIVSDEGKNRVGVVRLTSASAPNLTALASSSRGSSASSCKDGESERSFSQFSAKRENSSANEGTEEGEAPSISFAEMSIAISRWNHAVESQSLYNDARRPVLKSATLTGEATKSGSSDCADGRSVSVGPSHSPTSRCRRQMRGATRVGRSDEHKTPKNCLKTIPSGGVKSSFFGGNAHRPTAPSSPTKSWAGKTKNVPRLALRVSSSVQSRGRGGGGGGGNDNVSSRSASRLASKRLEDHEWESQLSSEMKKIYRHFKSYDETPRLRRGGTYQDLLLPTKSRRQSTSSTQRDIEVTTNLKAATKSVAFDIDSFPNESGNLNLGETVSDEPGIDAESRRPIGGIKSAPPPSDPASADKLYRRHIARYYARSATKYDEIKDSMFPEMPGMPPAAGSPFLNDARNQEVWEWLNQDFCKTKLDYFLSLCS